MYKTGNFWFLSIEVVRNIDKNIETTVGYLLGENALSELDKERILYALYGILRDAKTRQAYK